MRRSAQEGSWRSVRQVPARMLSPRVLCRVFLFTEGDFRVEWPSAGILQSGEELGGLEDPHGVGGSLTLNFRSWKAVQNQ